MAGIDLRLGIDVGGTNTDAVIMDPDDQLVAKSKVPGTSDVSRGIDEAIASVLAAADVDPARITHVMLGTTHATNAILERRKLGKVGYIRIGSPATHAVRPLFGWPEDLRRAISVGETIVGGGIEFDGRDLAPFDGEAVKRFLADVGPSAQGIAIASVFSPVSPRHELMALEIVRRELGPIHVSLSHQIGSIGLLERENATVLNAALVGVAREVTGAVLRSLSGRNLQPATYFTQNDGTLMALDYAMQYPVLTIGSGPANSIRGAGFLTRATDAVVLDVGGTSSDIGALIGGFPRDSSQGIEVGGVRTNFRMPDLVTVAIGGGTVVRGNPGGARLGPDSVGFRLQTEALIFGGSTLTLTDAATATGRASLGDRGVPDSVHLLATEALRISDRVLAEAIDRVKTSRADCTLIAVGGGSILLPDHLPGVSTIHRPPHFDVANAIGATIAAVSGQIDRIFHIGAGGRQAVLDEAGEESRQQAILAGADPRAVEIVEVEEIPLAYLTTPAVRLRVKAVGPLGTG
ncbi:MAG: hydantoinase/oxoprolinase N-terminal domain-containing protein [Candidatus Dormibacteria bacterium]